MRLLHLQAFAILLRIGTQQSPQMSRPTLRLLQLPPLGTLPVVAMYRMAAIVPH